MHLTSFSSHLKNNLLLSRKNGINSDVTLSAFSEESAPSIGFQDFIDKAKNQQLQETSSISSTTDHAVERLSLPSWFGDYIPNKAATTVELNYEYWNFAAKLTQDNKLTDDERAQLRHYLMNDSSHQAELEKRNFQEKYSNEIGEYITLLTTYFQDILNENSITHDEYYDKVILDKESSEKLHAEFDNLVQNNRRACELMKILR